MHLLVLNKFIKTHNPKTVIIDPISSLVTVGSINEVRDMLIRLIDVLKKNNISAFFTALTNPTPNGNYDLTVDAVSSLSDIWIDVENERQNGTHVRDLRIVKSRGMGHSTETHRFVITNKGILIEEPEKKIKINYNGNRRTEKV